ncbi:MAG: hypothetical protein QM211_04655 [Bacillota bacterium]|nr:hypothetical protein [Bacillota bacterium]
MDNIKAKRKINLGFIITISLLLLILILYIVMGSRVSIVKKELQKQAANYQTTIVDGLIVDPVNLEKINSAFSLEQDLEPIISEIVEEHWAKISPQVKDYYYDETVMEFHKKAFSDLLKQAYRSGTSIYSVSQMKIINEKTIWNLNNQIQTKTSWDVKVALDRQQNNLYTSDYKNIDLVSDDYFFSIESKTIWQKKDGQWKIVKSDIVYPREYLSENLYESYYYR